MKRAGNENVLFVTGMEANMEQILQQEINIHPDHMLILQIDEPVISQHFGDVMRDIVLGVYERNVREIYIVGCKDDSISSVDRQEIVKKMYRNEEVKEKVKTIDYLFQHCMPEFPGVELGKWLEPSKTSTEGIQKSVHMIRQHPLMPAHVTVRGMLFDKLNGKLDEIDC